MLASLLAGILNDADHPRWNFFIATFFAMIVTLCGFLLSKENDNEYDEDGNMIRYHNWSSIKEALKVP